MKFKIGSKVKCLKALNERHVGKTGVITEAPAYDKQWLKSHPQLYSVRLDEPTVHEQVDVDAHGRETGTRTYEVPVTLGCVPEDWLEAYIEPEPEDKEGDADAG